MNAAVPLRHYEAIFESSDDAILTKDRDATITSWNPAAERLYGHRSAEAVGQPITILIPSDRRGEEREILDRVLAGDRVNHYETERVTKDGAAGLRLADGVSAPRRLRRDHRRLCDRSRHHRAQAGGRARGRAFRT